MNKLIQQKWFPHLVAILIAIATIYVYMNPMLSGKVLKQFDVKQWQASYNEIAQFQTQTGERTFWTNSVFSGMPTYLIGPSYHNNFTNTLTFYLAKILPNPTDTLFLLFICFYIMLIVFDVGPWWAIAGSLAFMLSSFNFINIDAGHVGKGNAIAYMPLVIAGIQLTLRKNKLFGALLTGIALSLQLTAGHLQITYYLMILIIVWMIAELIIAIKEKTIGSLAMSGVFLVVAAIIGVATNSANLLATEEYGKYSIRGPSELTKMAQGADYGEVKSSGLDKDYALQWSNGTLEPFTLLIPNFYGGGNAGDPHTHELLTKHFKAAGFPQAKELAQGMPAYFGEQPFTAGPIYYGAIICFLFILGLLIIRSPMKWWILAISVLAILLSMGKNFMSLTDVFFYNFPLYNKFRSVTFILCITQTTFPLLAMLALKELADGTLKLEEAKKKLLYAFGIAGGLCLVFVIMPGIASVSAEIDDRLTQAGYPMDIIFAGREKLRQADALRSFIFIALAFGLCWALLIKKIKPAVATVVMIALVTIDLWGVDKRYLNDKDFEKKKPANAELMPKSFADEMILRDKDMHYRVFNTTQRLDQDALTSYWHKSIGGYHGAKLRRYQELIEFHLSQGNPEAYNMLNVKYFIIGDSTGQQYPQPNPDANGNAWFINNIIMVPNADAEIDSLKTINTKSDVLIDQRFADQIADFKPSGIDSSSRIKLTSYAPNKLAYSYETTSDQIAVFSEIYYDKGWNAYIDGNLAPHFRCNYVLRGMKLPAGTHQIEFRFEPEVVNKGEQISLIASIILYGGIVVIGALPFIRKKKDDNPNAA